MVVWTVAQVIWLANSRNSYESQCGEFRVFVRANRSVLVTQYVRSVRSRWTSAPNMRVGMALAQQWANRDAVSRWHRNVA